MEAKGICLYKQETHVEDSSRTIVTPPSAPPKQKQILPKISIELNNIIKKYLIILQVYCRSYLTSPRAVINHPSQALYCSHPPFKSRQHWSESSNGVPSEVLPTCVRFPTWV